MHSPFRWLLALLVVATSQSPARAQIESTPTFPSRVELITVDAVVVDAKGNPVLGLTKDDFLIREASSPRVPGSNLGPIQRTVNIPTLALLFLNPDQGRFAFEDKGRGKVAGVDAVQIGFIERAHPTVVGSTPEGSAMRGDVPASGRIWIEPETGAVLKTDVAYDFALEKPRQAQHVHAHVVTEYRREKVLGGLVPSEMHEAYEVPLDVGRGGNIFKDERDDPTTVSLTAVAMYSGYRRFEVTTDEAFRPTDTQ